MPPVGPVARALPLLCERAGGCCCRCRCGCCCSCRWCCNIRKDASHSGDRLQIFSGVAGVWLYWCALVFLEFFIYFYFIERLSTLKRSKMIPQAYGLRQFQFSSTNVSLTFFQDKCLSRNVQKIYIKVTTKRKVQLRKGKKITNIFAAVNTRCSN